MAKFEGGLQKKNEDIVLQCRKVLQTFVRWGKGGWAPTCRQVLVDSFSNKEINRQTRHNAMVAKFLDLNKRWSQIWLKKIGMYNV